MLRLSFCRARLSNARINATLDRETAIVWDAVHKIFPNLPKMKDGIEEPDVGAKLGRHHEIVSLMNSGQRAKVFLTRDNRTLESRALKCIPKVSLRSCDEVRRLDKEVAILKKLRHAHIIAILGE